MPWGRVDDTWYDHPKLDLLTDEHVWPDRLAAAGLESLAWSWCNRFLTDGHVPTAAVRKLGGTRELADMLVSIGRWEEAGGGGYLIHDFLVYNESREQVEERRRKEAARKALQRANKSPGGSPTGTPHSKTPRVPRGVPPGVPGGVPAAPRPRARSRPDPTRPIDSPNPAERGGLINPRENGTNPRALGTSPRQVAAAAKTEADERAEGRRYRRSQRQLAYGRGEITEAQQADMDGRDAKLTEIPGWVDHQAEISAGPSWMPEP